MLIAHSTFSCASACGGNEACETKRSTEKVGEGGWSPLDGESASPSESEPDSASLRELMVASLTEMVKPETGGEEMSVSTRRAIRGGWGERVLKDCQGIPGDPAWRAPVWVHSVQRERGNHNPLFCRARKSERLIVAMRRGNACGAKEPYFSHVSIEERSAA